MRSNRPMTSDRSSAAPGRQRTVVPLSVLPTRVQTDNSTSDYFTIIEVFAADRSGLLHRVARTIFELGLSVRLAKIATYLDQVLDVFYVTDHDGHKIDEPGRLEAIRARLLDEIEAVERQQAQRADNAEIPRAGQALTRPRNWQPIWNMALAPCATRRA